MFLETVFISPPNVPPQESEYVAFAVAFEKEDWYDMDVTNDAVEFNPVYIGKDEFSNIRAKWKDPLLLHDFYVENKAFFQTEYWNGLSEENLIADVVTSVPRIFKRIGESFIDRSFDKLFEPLSVKDEFFKNQNEQGVGPHQLVRLKSKFGYVHNKLPFRIYAIEVDVDCFIITGGTIKIVEEMKQAPNTDLELKKINYLYRELQQAKIYSKETLLNYLYERTE